MNLFAIKIFIHIIVKVYYLLKIKTFNLSLHLLIMETNPKIVEFMRQFAESVIQGLSNNKEKFGAPLCPCRYYDDKEDEISLAYWNCPCVPMRERKECHCMLFLTADSEFASNVQSF